MYFLIFTDRKTQKKEMKKRKSKRYKEWERLYNQKCWRKEWPKLNDILKRESEREKNFLTYIEIEILSLFSRVLEK